IHFLLQKVIYFLSVEHLFFKQSRGDDMQGIDVSEEKALRPLEATRHNRFQLGVYVLCGAFAEIPLAMHLLAQKDRLLFSPIIERPHLFAHAPLTDHLPGDFRGPLYVVARSGRLMVEADLFGRSPPEQNRDTIHKIIFRIRVPLVDGELLREAERPSSRYDGDFMDGV